MCLWPTYWCLNSLISSIWSIGLNEKKKIWAILWGHSIGPSLLGGTRSTYVFFLGSFVLTPPIDPSLCILMLGFMLADQSLIILKKDAWVPFALKPTDRLIILCTPLEHFPITLQIYARVPFVGLHRSGLYFLVESICSDSLAHHRSKLLCFKPIGPFMYL